jgi:voltage-gated potassium channel
MNNPFKRIVPPLIVLVVIITLATLGYTQIEHWRLLDALYMITITLATVGFKEVGPMSDVARIMTMALIIFGVGTVGYTVGQLVEMTVNGEIADYRGKRRMYRKMKELKDHYIICGYGRVGHQVTLEFDAEKVPYVVIDSKAETAKELDSKGTPYIIGDMSQDDLLESAGIERAKGLVACADSDTSNVFVTLSARVLNPKIFIIARASNLATETKLIKAGANRVISPYYIAGNRMASMAIRPIALDFLDTVMHSENVELALEEHAVDNNSAVVGRTLAELNIKQKTGANVLAIKHITGKFDLQPTANTRIEKEDVLVTLGTKTQLNNLKEMIKA